MPVPTSAPTSIPQSSASKGSSISRVLLFGSSQTDGIDAGTGYEIIRVSRDNSRDSVLKSLRSGKWGDVSAIWDLTASAQENGKEMVGFIWDEDLIEALPRDVNGFWGGDAAMVDMPTLKEHGT